MDPKRRRVDLPSLVECAQEQRRACQDRYTMRLIGDVEYYAVFDGNGTGAVADWLAVNLDAILSECMQRVDFNDPKVMKAAIRRAFRTADARVNREFDKAHEGIGASGFPLVPSGSTASVVLVRGARCYIAHVGDSPVVYQNMRGRRYVATAHDCHNPIEAKRVGDANQGGRLFGIMEPFRCFGVMDLKKKPEHKDGKRFILNAEPTVWTCDEPGYICLASDGVTEGLDADATKRLDLDLSADQMVTAAKQRRLSPWEGTSDDITVIRLRTK